MDKSPWLSPWPMGNFFPNSGSSYFIVMRNILLKQAVGGDSQSCHFLDEGKWLRNYYSSLLSGLKSLTSFPGSKTRDHV